MAGKVDDIEVYTARDQRWNATTMRTVSESNDPNLRGGMDQLTVIGHTGAVELPTLSIGAGQGAPARRILRTLVRFARNPRYASDQYQANRSWSAGAIRSEIAAGRFCRVRALPWAIVSAVCSLLMCCFGPARTAYGGDNYTNNRAANRVGIEQRKLPMMLKKSASLFARIGSFAFLSGAPVSRLPNRQRSAFYSKGKTCRQSRAISTIVQPFALASSRALSSFPMGELS